MHRFFWQEILTSEVLAQLWRTLMLLEEQEKPV